MSQMSKRKLIANSAVTAIFISSCLSQTNVQARDSNLPVQTQTSSKTPLASGNKSIKVAQVKEKSEEDQKMKDAKSMSKTEWQKKLSPEVYEVTRCGGTEAPFTGKYWNNHEAGVYRCSNCGEQLFDSKDKFDSGPVGRVLQKTPGQLRPSRVTTLTACSATKSSARIVMLIWDTCSTMVRRQKAKGSA